MDVILPDADLGGLLSHPLVEALLDSVSDGALVIDAHDRRILAMNAVARRLLGYQPDDVLGCQCRKAMNSPACAVACPLTSLMEGKPEGGELDLYYRGLAGREVLHAHTRMLLIRGPDGAPLAGVELFRDLREVRRLRRALGERRSLHGIIGSAPPMQALFELIEQVAPYDIPALITGESGVGKERFADALHHLSRRAEAPFVKVNCAALSPGVVESELFGHRRGAFTGATGDRRGRFEEADGGTLLLDEIGDLPLELQAKLLRVLQEGEVQRLGEERTRKVDVRILAATNRPLEEDVRSGRFRQDLYYRLAGVRLHIPPLRARRADIPLLAEHFLAAFGEERRRHQPGAPDPTLSPEATAALVDAEWPGNVRELESALRLAAIRCPPGAPIRAHHLTAPGAPASTSAPGVPAELPLALPELERWALDRAMEAAGGNLSAAARLLQIDRTTLWRKLKRMGD